jgi:ParB/RepB/Spo0J family partition protein
MAEVEKGARIELIPLRAIKPLPLQLTTIDPEVERMLLEDMRKGSERIDPILVRRLTLEEKEACKERYPKAEYEVIDGHKRLRNAELLLWEQIKAIVVDVSRDEAFEISYRKNKERGTVDPMLEAIYFKHLYIDKKLPAFKIAEMLSLSEKYVRRVIARVGIETEAVRKIVRQAVIGKPLTGKHLDAIAKTPPEKQPVIVEKIAKEGLTAKEAKIVAEAVAKKPAILELPKPKLVEEAKKITTPPPPPPPKPEEIREKLIKELEGYYPPIIIDYAYTRYKGGLLKEVIKASIFYMFWEKLNEAQREEVMEKAMKEVEEKGKFVEPVIG